MHKNSMIIWGSIYGGHFQTLSTRDYLSPWKQLLRAMSTVGRCLSHKTTTTTTKALQWWSWIETSAFLYTDIKAYMHSFIYRPESNCCTRCVWQYTCAWDADCLTENKAIVVLEELGAHSPLLGLMTAFERVCWGVLCFSVSLRASSSSSFFPPLSQNCKRETDLLIRNSLSFYFFKGRFILLSQSRVHRVIYIARIHGVIYITRIHWVIYITCIHQVIYITRIHRVIYKTMSKSQNLYIQTSLIQPKSVKIKSTSLSQPGNGPTRLASSLSNRFALLLKWFVPLNFSRSFFQKKRRGKREKKERKKKRKKEAEEESDLWEIWWSVFCPHLTFSSD